MHTRRHITNWIFATLLMVFLFPFENAHSKECSDANEVDCPEVKWVIPGNLVFEVKGDNPLISRFETNFYERTKNPSSVLTLICTKRLFELKGGSKYFICEPKDAAYVEAAAIYQTTPQNSTLSIITSTVSACSGMRCKIDPQVTDCVTYYGVCYHRRYYPTHPCEKIP